MVTGHDENNVAKVIIDDIATNAKSSRPGQISTLMWCTDSMPCDMPVGEHAEDMGQRILGTYPPVNGTRFMIAEYPPGNVPRRHRTETIDYIIVLSGEIDMELDKGETVTLKTGDVMIQRGTYHAWINRGSGALPHGVRADRRQASGDRRAGAARGGASLSRPKSSPIELKCIAICPALLVEERVKRASTRPSPACGRRWSAERRMRVGRSA